MYGQQTTNNIEDYNADDYFERISQVHNNVALLNIRSGSFLFE